MPRTCLSQKGQQTAELYQFSTQVARSAKGSKRANFSHKDFLVVDMAVWQLQSHVSVLLN